MKLSSRVLAFTVAPALIAACGSGSPKSILFVGNSYTFARVDPALSYNAANVPVSVHVYGGVAADNAIEAGVDSIEHGFFLTDAQLRRIK